MQKKWRVSFIFLLLYSAVTAQPQWNHWFFGAGNALDFSAGDPVYSAGPISTEEGASAISDKNGNLLFYTDGISVWNRLHELMPEGYGLHGGAMGSSTQGSLIVPKDDNGFQYYIFTTDEEGRSNGLKYSIVDMRMDAGRGDVIVKNVSLLTPVCEKLTAVLHCDKKSYWIITHQYGSADFYAFHADKDGVSVIPVISTAGRLIPITVSTMAGQLKVSPDGKKIAWANHSMGIEMADFDNSTGKINNAVPVFTRDYPGSCYGVEFSPNSLLLYTSVGHYRNTGDPALHTSLFQYNIALASTYEVVRYPAGNFMASLQRAPNGKIYIANYTKTFLSAIHFPNTEGIGCNFEQRALEMETHGELSLTSFVNDYYGTKDSFGVVSAGRYCANTAVQFTYTKDAVLLRWDFGDPSSGAANSFDGQSPTHYFSRRGIYIVQLIRYGRCENDTIRKEIKITDATANLGPDKSICEQNPVMLYPNAGSANIYEWNDGSTSSSFTAMQAGLYWVSVTNTVNGCVKRDSIVLLPPADGHCTLYVPTGFTPDGNGRNDLFKVQGTGLVDALRIKIFNRSGKLIYSSPDKNSGWNGKFNGAEQPPGIYVYMIEYKERDSEKWKLLKGTVMLIR